MAKEKKIKDATVSEEKVKKTKKQAKKVEEIDEVTEVSEVEDIDSLELDNTEIEEVEETKKDKKNKKEAKDSKKEEKPKKEKREGFFTKMGRELKKVVWPKAGDVFKYTMAVLVFCVGLCLFFKGMELLAALLKELLS